MEDLQDCEWTPIPGYEELYLFRINDTIKGGEVFGIKSNRKKVPCLDKDGYLRTTLCKNGIQKTFALHQISALIYLPNPENKSQVNHKYGIKTDNRPSQIEWCTIKENNQHAFRTGLKTTDKGEKDSQSIPVIQKTLDGEFIKSWGSTRQAAKSLNLYTSHISRACKGVFKQYRGYKWEYNKQHN